MLDTLFGSNVFAPKEKVRIKERMLIIVFINIILTVMNDNEKGIAYKIIQLDSGKGYFYSYSLVLFKFLLIYKLYFFVS